MEKGVFSQLGEVVGSMEELDALVKKAQADMDEATRGWVEIPGSGGVRVPPEQAKDFLKPVAQPVQLPAEAPHFEKMLQGTATNRLRLTATRNIVIDPVTGNAVIEEEGFKAFFKDYTALKGGLSAGAKKLLDAGALKLTENNHFRAKNGSGIETAVSISLEEYGTLRGYDLTERPTSTPEEADKEKRRVRNVMTEMRKRVNAEMDLLYSLSLSWKEPQDKTKGKDYDDVRILQRKGIRKGYINLRFSEDITAYLAQAYIMQYPLALQRLDERNTRSYNIGFKLALHNSIDNNRIKGTANIISIKALTEAGGDFPTFEEVMEKDRGHWEQRIKEPLERALDANTEGGVLEEWEYSNSKGVPLTDGQVSIPDYHTFIGLYIHFQLKDAPDQTARLEAKKEANAARDKTEKERKQKAKQAAIRRAASKKNTKATGGDDHAEEASEG